MIFRPSTWCTPKQSTPESGACAGYDGTKHKRGSKAHQAVDTVGQLLALHVTPANAQDCTQADALAGQVQNTTRSSDEMAYVDQGYTGDQAEQAATVHGLRSEVVKLPQAKKGFVLWPRR